MNNICLIDIFLTWDFAFGGRVTNRGYK
jgi:hypothetical protein